MNYDVAIYNQLNLIRRNNSIERSLIRWKGTNFESAFLKYLSDVAEEYIYIYCKNIEDWNQPMIDDMLLQVNKNRTKAVTVKVFVISEDQAISAKYQGTVVSKRNIVIKTNVSKSHFVICDDKFFGMKIGEDEWIASFDAIKTVKTMKTFFEESIK